MHAPSSKRVKTWHTGRDDSNTSSMTSLTREILNDVSLMADFDVGKLAIPSVCLLISFLAYSSQALFLHLDPGPLTRTEVLRFNSLVLCIWVCYFRACRTSPGNVPPRWTLQVLSDGTKQEQESEGCMARSRWCRKCEILKPPRAHHCKACGRFVLSDAPSRITLIVASKVHS